MKSFVAIALRELTRRRSDYLVAAVAGLLPLTVRFLPAFARGEEGLVQFLALQLAVIIVAVVSVSIGSSVICRDLCEGRLGFYFARPISSFALWGGKMAAAYAQLLAITVLVLAPSMLASWKAYHLLFGRFGALLPVAALCLPLYLLSLSHAVTILVRSRSAWMVLPLGVWIVFSIAGSLLAEDPLLLQKGTWTLFPTLISCLLAIASLLAAGFIQVHLGRTDLQRGAKALAIAWSIGMVVNSFVTSLISAGYAHWAL